MIIRFILSKRRRRRRRRREGGREGGRGGRVTPIFWDLWEVVIIFDPVSRRRNGGLERIV